VIVSADVMSRMIRVPQLYVPVPTKFLTDTMGSLDGAALKVYLTLCLDAASVGTKLTFSNASMAQRTGITPRMVQKVIRQLVEAGCIRRQARRPGPAPNAIEMCFPPSSVRPAPKTVAEWISVLGDEPTHSSLITSGLILLLRKAADQNESILLEALRRLHHQERTYDLKDFPEGLINDVLQECHSTTRLSA